MGNVHSGAEVAADGDIHVYGKLSGYVCFSMIKKNRVTSI